MTSIREQAERGIALDERINAGCTCARAGLCWRCEDAARIRELIATESELAALRQRHEKLRKAAVSVLTEAWDKLDAALAADEGEVEPRRPDGQY